VSVQEVVSYINLRKKWKIKMSRNSHVVVLAQKLIKCPSVTPADEGALNIIKEELQQIKFDTKEYEFGEGKEKVKNLFGWRVDNPGKPVLTFSGHTDVVPAGDIDKWSFAPFDATIYEKNLIGRGAVDMKGAIAAFISAARRYVLEGGKPNISFLITGDEEGVAVNGTKKLLEAVTEEGLPLGDCIVGEPTNPSKLGQMMKIGRRGSITFHLEVEGVQGHVAYPHLADNPVSTLVNILRELQAIKLDSGNKFFQSSNLELTTIDVGNQADNLIPAKARATFNIRFTNQHTGRELEELIRNCIQNYTNNYKLTVRLSGEAFLTEPNDFVRLVQREIENVLGIEPELSTSGGTSDARFIKDYVNVLEFGLINETAHKVDEKVSVKDLEKLSEIYYSIIKRYFS
jgi:succinyl-diaminopimelate desuccinylase